MSGDLQTMEQAIIERLRQIIDPETGADVIRMRLVEDLVVEESGQVRYTFRPSSPLCPIAVPLAQMIKTAIAEVPGVTDQEIQVKNYIGAEMLTRILNQKEK
jgi:metal-sulfur cluster biosynthetic enzyme